MFLGVGHDDWQVYVEELDTEAPPPDQDLHRLWVRGDSAQHSISFTQTAFWFIKRRFWKNIRLCAVSIPRPRRQHCCQFWFVLWGQRHFLKTAAGRASCPFVFCWASFWMALTVHGFWVRLCSVWGRGDASAAIIYVKWQSSSRQRVSESRTA